jgi:hypothetical protein
MRSRRLIVALLLVAAAGAKRAGGMTATTRVGTVVRAIPQVEGMLDGKLQPLSERAAVWLQMEVATRAGAKAHIALDGGERNRGCTRELTSNAVSLESLLATRAGAAPSGTPGGDKGGDSACGALIMGEKSRVLFDQWVVDQATWPKVGFRALVGDFLVFFRPRPRNLVAGSVRIQTPAGTIELEGTALRLRVAENGTTRIDVLEGTVTVKGAEGGQVRVPAGSGTDMAPGRAPLPPSPRDPRSDTLSPRAHGVAFNMPGEQLDDPPNLDVRRLTLDLPKVWRP